MQISCHMILYFPDESIQIKQHLSLCFECIVGIFVNCVSYPGINFFSGNTGLTWCDTEEKTQKKHIMRLLNLSRKWKLNVLLISLCPILLLLCFLLQSPSNYLSVSIVFQKTSLWNHDWSIEPCYSTRW